MTRSKKADTVLFLLFLIYLGILLRITVFRSDFGQYPLFENGRISVTLFRGYFSMIKRKHWFLAFYLFFGNIFCFSPLGMYLQYKNRKGALWQAALYGFLFSLMIETMQYVFGVGLSEIDDLILNTVGVWLGAAAVCCIHAKRTGTGDRVLCLRNGMAGEQDRTAGKKDSITGEQDGMSGKEDGMAGEQDRTAGKGDGMTGEQDRTAGKEDGMTGKLDGVSGKEDGMTRKRDRTAGEKL